MKTHGFSWGFRLLIFTLIAAVLTACAGNSGAGGSINNVNGGNALENGGLTPAAEVEMEEIPTEELVPTEEEVVPSTGNEATVEPTATNVVDETPTQAQEQETPAVTTPETAPTSTVEAQPVNVTSFPDPAGFRWTEVTSGLRQPLDLTSPPDGSGRLVILEQPGTIRIFQDDSLLPEPFLDIQSRVRSTGSEQGLLGIAFHPDFAQNNYFFLNYTDLNGDTIIARYQVSADDPNLADPNSETILLQVDQPYANHNGGGLAFGPDGYLYITLGDGGSAGDPQGNAQSLNTHLGKLLRIDVNQGDMYGIPEDNPFIDQGEPEIWAYGLRNAWRFSFDRATGDLYIADVGQNAWEEVNFLPADAPAGANFGWDYFEGTHPYEGTPPADAELVDPVYEYEHGLGCSVTGGYVYRGQQLEEFSGIYLFSDFCTGRVWGMLRGEDGSWQTQELFQTGWNVTSFGEDADGEIYLMDQRGGTVYRLERSSGASLNQKSFFPVIFLNQGAAALNSVLAKNEDAVDRN